MEEYQDSHRTARKAEALWNSRHVVRKVGRYSVQFRNLKSLVRMPLLLSNHHCYWVNVPETMILTAVSTMNSFSISPDLYVTTSSLRSGHPHLPSLCHELMSWLLEGKGGIMSHDGFCSTKQGPQPSRFTQVGRAIPLN